MNFSDALKEIKSGQDLRRKGWNGKGMNVHYRASKIQGELPYLEMTTVQGTLVPWLASQTDILAEDWEFAT